MRRIKQWISQIIFPFGITFNISKVKSSCFVEIKNTALALQANNDLRSYNKYINKLSEQKFKRIKFVGQGACIDTTATHTIVSLSNQQFYFEKIFNVNSIHYKRFINNYPLIQNPLIERGITIPKLKSNYELSQISICHFEYFDTLIKVDENILKYGFSIISKFKTISFNESFITKDYTEINYLRYCINALFNELVVENEVLFQFFTIKQFVDNQPHVFAHGDFYPNNIYENCITDWDDVGFYPYGIDTAAIMIYYNYYILKNMSIDNVILNLDKQALTNSEIITTSFFYIILSGKYVPKAERLKWISELYEKVQLRK